MTAETQDPHLHEPRRSAPPPWSVKGVSDTARRAARDAADAAGLNVGEWLNRVIAQANERASEPRPQPAAVLQIDPPVALPTPDLSPTSPVVIPRVADAITALEGRIGDAQQRISVHYAPLRTSVEVLGVRIGALERVGTLADTGRPAPTREALARRLSGQGPIRPSADEHDSMTGAPIAGSDADTAPRTRRRHVLRRVAAGTSVFAVGASAAYIAIWFSLLSGPSNPGQITAALPVDVLALAAGPNQDAIDPPVTSDEVLQLRLEAEAGSPAAQLQLANLYVRGTGVTQDYTAAAQWFGASADRGNPVAQYSLAVLNERGLGVPQDTGTAAVWYERAARQQHPNAQYALGIAFLEGRGKPQDYRQAAVWLERAARQDVGDAQYAYAVILEDGLIAPPDNARAYEWYQAAIANGSSQAAERAALLVPRLVTTSSQPALPSIPSTAVRSADVTDRFLILQIEQLLSNLDFAVGTPDGILAAATVAAIEEYQATLELPTDGRPSQQLLDHLQSVTGR